VAPGSDSTRPKLGVAVPLANEGATVADFLQRVVRQLAAGDRVFCVVDRASTDDTRSKVEAASRDDGRIVLVWAPENTCVVDAYFQGYRAALEANCEWILEMDGGLSHLPEEIPRFVAAMESGVDFAAGSRFVAQGSFRGTWRRRLVSWGGTRLVNLMLATRMRDMTSGFECFTRTAMEVVVRKGVRSRAHFFQTEIRYMLRDCEWVEVPITYSCPSNRLGGAPIREALRNLWLLRSGGRA